jgi:hypothetical protein
MIGGEAYMNSMTSSSQFQQAIEAVEQLPPNDQALLIEIIRQRLIEQRRAELAVEVAEARADYQQGKARRGSVADLMKELGE